MNKSKEFYELIVSFIRPPPGIVLSKEDEAVFSQLLGAAVSAIEVGKLLQECETNVLDKGTWDVTEAITYLHTLTDVGTISCNKDYMLWSLGYFQNRFHLSLLAALKRLLQALSQKHFSEPIQITDILQYLLVSPNGHSHFAKEWCATLEGRIVKWTSDSSTAFLINLKPSAKAYFEIDKTEFLLTQGLKGFAPDPFNSLCFSNRCAFDFPLGGNHTRDWRLGERYFIEIIVSVKALELVSQLWQEYLKFKKPEQ